MENFLTELNAVLDEQKANHLDPAITEAWKMQRLGKFTSSSISKLLVKSSNKEKVFGAATETYIFSRIGEMLTQEQNEMSSAAIKWGEEHEADAVKMFERLHNKEVVYFGKGNPVFYNYFPEGEKEGENEAHAGGSPDGFIEAEKAVVETKCPYASGNHAEMLYLVKTGKFDLKKFDADYYGQVQFNIHLTGAAYAYFVSYDPRCVDYKYSVVAAKIKKDDEYLKKLFERIKLAVEVKLTALKDIGFFGEDV